MKTFDWKAFKNTSNNIAVHCKTEEEAKDFHKQAKEYGVDCLINDCSQKYGLSTTYGNHLTWGRVDTYICHGYTILEWSDYMEKPFTKADLRVGDIVKTRQGNILVILPNENSSDGLGTFSRITHGCQQYLSSYEEDLTYKNAEYDIVAVLRASEPGYHQYNTYRLLGVVLTYNDHEMIADQFQYVKWDWERTEEEPIKELTMEELEKVLGYKVKIVAEEN